MSSKNKTTNYNLSQFVGTDVPSYLGDYNGDMSKIDKAIGDVANSQGSVEQSVVGLTADVQGLSTQVSGVSTSVQQLQTSVAQIDSGYKQADTALNQRITANANNIQTNTTAIESANTAIGNINTAIGTEDISQIGDGTIKGAIGDINSSLNSKMNGIVVKQEPYFVIIKIGAFCIMNGYFSEAMEAWSWITKVDSSIFPISGVTNSANNVQIRTNGEILVTTNVDANVAYSICWATNN